MKRIVSILFLLLIFISTRLCAEAGTNKATTATGVPKLLYSNFGFFSGMHVKIASDDKIYGANNPAIERLLTSTAKGKEYLDGYYFKYGEHSVIIY